MSMFEGAIGIVVDPVVDIMVMLISGLKLRDDKGQVSSPESLYGLPPVWRFFINALGELNYSPSVRSSPLHCCNDNQATFCIT